MSFSHDQHCLQLAELDQYAGEIRNDCNELQRTAGKAWWKLRHNRWWWVTLLMVLIQTSPYVSAKIWKSHCITGDGTTAFSSSCSTTKSGNNRRSGHWWNSGRACRIWRAGGWPSSSSSCCRWPRRPYNSLGCGSTRGNQPCVGTKPFQGCSWNTTFGVAFVGQFERWNMGRTVARNNILREVANRLESIAPRHQIMTPELANRLMQRTMEIRGMMWWTIEGKKGRNREGNLGNSFKCPGFAGEHNVEIRKG